MFESRGCLQRVDVDGVGNIYLAGNVCRLEDVCCWRSIGRAMRIVCAVFLGWGVFAGPQCL